MAHILITTGCALHRFITEIAFISTATSFSQLRLTFTAVTAGAKLGQAKIFKHQLIAKTMKYDRAKYYFKSQK